MKEKPCQKNLQPNYSSFNSSINKLLEIYVYICSLPRSCVPKSLIQIFKIITFKDINYQTVQICVRSSKEMIIKVWRKQHGPIVHSKEILNKAEEESHSLQRTTAPALHLADGEHLVSFSGPFSGCCWAETGRKKTLYVGDRTIYRILLETA